MEQPVCVIHSCTCGLWGPLVVGCCALWRVIAAIQAGTCTHKPKQTHTYIPRHHIFTLSHPHSGRRPEDKPELQRLRTLVGLLACRPMEAGDCMLAEVYSPHLDTYQRLLILDTLGAAAQELSNPRLQPQLEVGPGGKPSLVYPGARAQGQAQQGVLPAPASGPMVGSGPGAPGGGGAVVPGGVLRAGKTRVWGKVALAKAAAPKVSAHRNKFTDVALRWAVGLMREVGGQQGVCVLFTYLCVRCVCVRCVCVM